MSTGGGQLGEPDLVLTMKDAFEVPAGGLDIYRNFVLPLALDEDKWVSTVEVIPGDVPANVSVACISVFLGNAPHPAQCRNERFGSILNAP